MKIGTIVKELTDAIDKCRPAGAPSYVIFATDGRLYCTPRQDVPDPVHVLGKITRKDIDIGLTAHAWDVVILAAIKYCKEHNPCPEKSKP